MNIRTFRCGYYTRIQAILCKRTMYGVFGYDTIPLKIPNEVPAHASHVKASEAAVSHFSHLVEQDRRACLPFIPSPLRFIEVCCCLSVRAAQSISKYFINRSLPQQGAEAEIKPWPQNSSFHGESRRCTHPQWTTASSPPSPLQTGDGCQRPT